MHTNQRLCSSGAGSEKLSADAKSTRTAIATAPAPIELKVAAAINIQSRVVPYERIRYSESTLSQQIRRQVCLTTKLTQKLPRLAFSAGPSFSLPSFASC